MKNRLWCLLSAIVLSFQANAYQPEFDTIVTFGDSLSDNGNLYKYMLHILPASPPYYNGHFSNGPIWIEQLYNAYFPENNTEGLQDYAVGGAGAVLSRKENLPFTITAELDSYLYWHTYGKKETTLYTIWIGANNYVNGPSNVEDLTNGVVDAIESVVEKLIAKGGNKFLIANLPDLASAPYTADAKDPALLTQLTQTHNQKLQQRVLMLQKKYPETLFIYFDVYTDFLETINNAHYYGFSTTDKPCYLGGYTGLTAPKEPTDVALYQFLKQQTPTLPKAQWDMINNDPFLKEAAKVGYYYQSNPAFKNKIPESCDGYLFWDKLHPSTAFHALIASRAKALLDAAGLQAIASPSTYQGVANGRSDQ